MISRIFIGLCVLFLLIIFGIFSLIPKSVKAQKFGGVWRITLEPDRKLVNASWSNGSVWILTRQMNPGDSIETYTLTEKSKLGLAEGEVVIEEKSSK